MAVFGTKSLVQVLNKNTGLGRRKSEAILNIFLSALEDALLSGHLVRLRDFGSFSTYRRSAYNGINPLTMEPVHIEPRMLIKFRSSDNLRKKVKLLPIPEGAKIKPQRKRKDGSPSELDN